MDESETTNPPTDTRPARNSGGGSGGSGGREDCWSEQATAVLIEAWGVRHLRSNRGNLRQNDWREVSDAVNVWEVGEKPRKSDVQCKNRIDTLKKKYKAEKAKSAPSSWKFFSQMDYLIGTGSGGKKSGGMPSNFIKKQKGRFLVTTYCDTNPNSSAIPKRTSGGSSPRFDSVDSSDSESYLGGGMDVKRRGAGVRRKPRRRVEVNSAPQEKPFSDLAKAILKFGEIYERTESSKREQLVELEKQRMEFTKDLELQRMKLLTEAHVEVEKILRSKNASNSGDTSNKL